MPTARADSPAPFSSPRQKLSATPPPPPRCLAGTAPKHRANLAFPGGNKAQVGGSGPWTQGRPCWYLLSPCSSKCRARRLEEVPSSWKSHLKKARSTSSTTCTAAARSLVPSRVAVGEACVWGGGDTTAHSSPQQVDGQGTSPRGPRGRVTLAGSGPLQALAPLGVHPLQDRWVLITLDFHLSRKGLTGASLFPSVSVPRGKDMQGKAGRSSQAGRPALALWKDPPPPSELLATGRAATLLLSQGLRVGTKRRLQRNGRIVCCNLWLAGNFAPRSKSHSSLRQPGKSLPSSRQHMAVMLAPEMPI